MTGRRAGRDPAAHAEVVVAAGLLAAGAGLTALVMRPRTLATVHRLDERWFAAVQRSRSAPLETVSRALDVGFGTTVDWTARAVVTAELVRRRRWAPLAGWVLTVLLGEVSVGPVKAAVDRIRPPEPMTATSMMSYPSGHALAATTTAVGAVLALRPPGSRALWLAGAVGLSWATAASRTYLNAHWLSDVVGGAALGTGYAMAAPHLVDLVRHAAGRAVPGGRTASRRALGRRS